MLQPETKFVKSGGNIIVSAESIDDALNHEAMNPHLYEEKRAAERILEEARLGLIKEAARIEAEYAENKAQVESIDDDTDDLFSDDD